MWSGLVEQEAAAYLDLLILSQLHLAEEIDRELCSLFLIHLSPETRALEEGNGYHVVVKLPRFFAVCSNHDSVEKVADARIVDLDCQSREPRSCATRT